MDAALSSLPLPNDDDRARGPAKDDKRRDDVQAIITQFAIEPPAAVNAGERFEKVLDAQKPTSDVEGIAKNMPTSEHDEFGGAQQSNSSSESEVRPSHETLGAAVQTENATRPSVGAHVLPSTEAGQELTQTSLDQDMAEDLASLEADGALELPTSAEEFSKSLDAASDGNDQSDQLRLKMADHDAASPAVQQRRIQQHALSLMSRSSGDSLARQHGDTLAAAADLLDGLHSTDSAEASQLASGSGSESQGQSGEQAASHAYGLNEAPLNHHSLPESPGPTSVDAQHIVDASRLGEWMRDRVSELTPGADGTRTWQLRLDPAGLDVRVVLRQQGGRWSASFFAAATAGVAELEPRLNELREALMDAGLTVDSLEVEQDARDGAGSPYHPDQGFEGSVGENQTNDNPASSTRRERRSHRETDHQIDLYA